MQTVGSILIVAVSFYVIIFTLFEREPELFLFTTLGFSAEELSFWDEWWDTGRPTQQSLSSRFGSEELWPLLKQKFKNLQKVYISWYKKMEVEILILSRSICLKKMLYGSLIIKEKMVFQND